MSTITSEIKDKIGLYIHIPFCKAKCNYCDFNSYAGCEKNIPGYFEALGREIMLYKDKLKGYCIKTIFIGGGTPSYVEPKYISQVLNEIRNHFYIEDNAEITIETNPGTLSENKLSAYLDAGINRLSIGLQAWKNSILKELGRIHTIEEFTENYNAARKAGFNNINIDLIFGIPGQSQRDWEETLNNILILSPEHLSCYSLKIEEGTVFGERLQNGSIIPLEDEDDREMYHYCVEILKKHGYIHYEISNFAKAGFLCRHNLVYWKEESYVGLGAGAHSFFEGERYSNLCSMDEYIFNIMNSLSIVENVETIDENEQIAEFMILGLRLMDGISINEFKERFNKDIFDQFGDKISGLTGRDLLIIDGDRIKLSGNGMDLANQVYMEFI